MSKSTRRYIVLARTRRLSALELTINVIIIVQLNKIITKRKKKKRKKKKKGKKKRLQYYL